MIRNHCSNLCRVVGGLSDHQNLAKLSAAIRPGRVLRPGNVLSIGGAAIVAGASSSRVRPALPMPPSTHSPILGLLTCCPVLHMPSDYARYKARNFDASSVSLAQLQRFGNFLLPVQARAITQQARSPVIRVYAASPDQTISDSAADSNLESVTSEAPSNGSSNGSGHASPQSATEGNGCAVDAWQRLSELRRLLYKQQCHLHGKLWR